MAVKDPRDVLTALENLAVHARTERIPDVDVSRPVLRRLRNHQRPSDRGLAILTASALAVAVIVAIFSFSDFVGALDPLAMMMETTASSLI